jgi:hypothetical protein
LTSLQERLGKASKTTEGEESSVERETSGDILLSAAATSAATGATAVTGLLGGLIVEGNALELALDLAVATLAGGSEGLELIAGLLDVSPRGDIEGTLDIVERGELSPIEVSNGSSSNQGLQLTPQRHRTS